MLEGGCPVGGRQLVALAELELGRDAVDARVGGGARLAHGAGCAGGVLDDELDDGADADGGAVG